MTLLAPEQVETKVSGVQRPAAAPAVAAGGGGGAAGCSLHHDRNPSGITAADLVRALDLLDLAAERELVSKEVREITIGLCVQPPSHRLLAVCLFTIPSGPAIPFPPVFTMHPTLRVRDAQIFYSFVDMNSGAAHI